MKINIKHLKTFFTAVFFVAVTFFYNVSMLIASTEVGPPGSGGGFENPLGNNVGTISVLLVNIAQWMLGISAILALLALVVGGIRFILSFGNDRGVASAKANIQWAVAGLIIILLSYAIIRWVSGAIGVSL